MDNQFEKSVEQTTRSSRGESSTPAHEASWDSALQRSGSLRRRGVILGGYIRIFLSLIWLCWWLFHGDASFAIICTSGYLLVSILFLWIGKMRETDGLTVARIVFDVLFVTFLAHVLGSRTTTISIYYMVILVGYLLQQGRRMGGVALGSALLSYLVLLLLEDFDILSYAPFAEGMTAQAASPPSAWYGPFVSVASAMGVCYVLLRSAVSRVENFFQAERRVLAMEKEAAEKLAHMQKQADEAKRLESLGRLAGGIAHDFNNLLTGIVSYADFVKDAIPKDSAAVDDLKVISQAAKRAGDLTAQLLAFGRKQLIQPRVLKVDKLLFNLTDILRRTLGEHITVVLEQDPDIWAIKGDPGQIEQVVMNLAINARDAMPRGGVLNLSTKNVIVGSEQRLRNLECSYGRYVEISVRDSGIGISKNFIDHIFEPFFTTKNLGEGTGLGLATVYGIVKQHNGCVAVETEPGEGTEFRVYLPVAQETYVTSVPPPAYHSSGKGTILLAEDEEIVRRSTARILASKQYDVLEARSGEEALEIAEQHEGHIDLLLTDVVMTGISGKVLSLKLKETRPNVRVVFMSGYTENTISKEGVLDEETMFVAKPFLAENLLQKIEDALNLPGEASR